MECTNFKLENYVERLEKLDVLLIPVDISHKHKITKIIREAFDLKKVIVASEFYDVLKGYFDISSPPKGKWFYDHDLHMMTKRSIYSSLVTMTKIMLEISEELPTVNSRSYLQSFINRYYMTKTNINQIYHNMLNKYEIKTNDIKVKLKTKLLTFFEALTFYSFLKTFGSKELKETSKHIFGDFEHEYTKIYKHFSKIENELKLKKNRQELVFNVLKFIDAFSKDKKELEKAKSGRMLEKFNEKLDDLYDEYSNEIEIYAGEKNAFDNVKNILKSIKTYGENDFWKKINKNHGRGDFANELYMNSSGIFGSLYSVLDNINNESSQILSLVIVEIENNFSEMIACEYYKKNRHKEPNELRLVLSNLQNEYRKYKEDQKSFFSLKNRFHVLNLSLSKLKHNYEHALKSGTEDKEWNVNNHENLFLEMLNVMEMKFKRCDNKIEDITEDEIDEIIDTFKTEKIFDMFFIAEMWEYLYAGDNELNYFFSRYKFAKTIDELNNIKISIHLDKLDSEDSFAFGEMLGEHFSNELYDSLIKLNNRVMHRSLEYANAFLMLSEYSKFKSTTMVIMLVSVDSVNLIQNMNKSIISKLRITTLSGNIIDKVKIGNLKKKVLNEYISSIKKIIEAYKTRHKESKQTLQKIFMTSESIGKMEARQKATENGGVQEPVFNFFDDSKKTTVNDAFGVFY